MKCLHCGHENDSFLCPSCRTPDILDKIFNDIRRYNPETCENSYLAEYAAGLTERYAERDIIPQILDLFSEEISEYYYCRYFRMRRDPRTEETCLAYLKTHDLSDVRTQAVLYDLLDNYIPNDFVKPQKWCELIAGMSGLYCELYLIAAKYNAMIGEYDASDALAEKALQASKNENSLLFYSPENIINAIEKQKNDTLRYRTKKPYWPTTEDRRRAVAAFYDEKGILYPRIENMPAKVPENEFAPLNECFDDDIAEYSAFWCAEAFSVSSAKSIYQIAAVKVKDGNVTDSFSSFIRPWDGGLSARKTAAKEVGVAVEIIETAEYVDKVIPKFFEFVGDDVLVSTGALGNQAKLLSRAARYAGMNMIKNPFFDLLDFAADTSVEFDFKNNTREYLLKHFSVIEGKDALGKAMSNKTIFDKLKSYGE